MIVPMKRLTLVALKEDEGRILTALQAINAVQVIAGEEAPQDDPQLVCAENNVQRLSNALGLAKPYGPKKSLLEPKPEASVAELRAALPEALKLGEELETVDRNRAAVRAATEKCNAQIQSLAPWAGLPIPMDNVRSTKSAEILTGLIEAEELSALAAGLPETAALEVYGGEGERAVLIACPKDTLPEVNAVLKQTSWADYVFPKLSGTPNEAIEELQNEIKELAKQETALELQMRELGAKRNEIAGAADVAVIERDRCLAKTALLKTAATFVLQGWVRSDETEKVEAALKNVTEAYHLGIREPEEGETPPSVVHNTNFATPYEAVTNLYSRPDPYSMDGTPYMAPFYFLLFGMMLSDTGYGIVLFIGCLLFIKMAKPTGMMGALAKVIMMGGLSTIVWGVLIGSFFGMSWNDLFGLGASGPFPLIMDPMTQPIPMLFLCFGLGVIHIMFGLVLKIRLCFKSGDWQTAIFDNLSWMMVVLGLIIGVAGPMALPGVPVLGTIGVGAAALGALMILFMKGRGKRNPIKRLVSGLGELYNVTGYLSDILSYARLFALGIATGVIGSVFNSLASMIMGASSNPIVHVLLMLIAVALLVFLHLFNIAINTLGTFVHCARLQYVEFYGKFYETGGKEFKPLGYKTRHVRVTE